MGKFLAIFRIPKIPIIKSIKKAQELPKNRKLRNPKNNIIKKNLKISRLKRIIITILLKIISWSAKRHYLKRWDGKKTNASKQLTKSTRKKYKNIALTKLNSIKKEHAIVVIFSSVFSVSLDPTALERNEQKIYFFQE